MAEILIAARDLPSGYRRGDPVAVKPNGQTWGRAEVPPDFYVIKIPGLDVPRAKALLEPLVEAAQFGDPEFNAPDEADRVIVRHRRRVRAVVDDLRPADRTVLESEGVLETTVNGIRDAARKLAYNRAARAVEVTEEREFPRGGSN